MWYLFWELWHMEHLVFMRHCVFAECGFHEAYAASVLKKTSILTLQIYIWLKTKIGWQILECSLWKKGLKINMWNHVSYTGYNVHVAPCTYLKCICNLKKTPFVCAPLPLHWLCSDSWLQAADAGTLACFLLQLTDVAKKRQDAASIAGNLLSTVSPVVSPDQPTSRYSICLVCSVSDIQYSGT